MKGGTVRRVDRVGESVLASTSMMFIYLQHINRKREWNGTVVNSCSHATQRNILLQRSIGFDMRLCVI